MNTRLFYRKASGLRCAIVLLTAASLIEYEFFHRHLFGGQERNSEMLVWFQRDDNLAVKADGSGKCRWSDAVDKKVSVQGVLWCKGKQIAPRLVLDNTSIFLLFDQEPDEEDNGRLISVSGRLRLKTTGGGLTTDSGSPPGKAYFVEVMGWAPISNVREFQISVR